MKKIVWRLLCFLHHVRAHCAFGQINVFSQRGKFSASLSFVSYWTVRYQFFTELTMFCTALALFCIGVTCKLYCNQSECRNFFMYSINKFPRKMRYSVHRVKCKSHLLLYKIVFKTSTLARYKCYQNAFLAWDINLFINLFNVHISNFCMKLHSYDITFTCFLIQKCYMVKENPFTCEKYA